MPLEELPNLVTGFAGVEKEDDDQVALVLALEGIEKGELLGTGATPRSPQGYQQHLAPEA
jgi:hypothetical protein